MNMLQFCLSSWPHILQLLLVSLASFTAMFLRSSFHLLSLLPHQQFSLPPLYCDFFPPLTLLLTPKSKGPVLILLEFSDYTIAVPSSKGTFLTGFWDTKPGSFFSTSLMLPLQHSLLPLPSLISPFLAPPPWYFIMHIFKYTRKLKESYSKYFYSHYFGSAINICLYLFFSHIHSFIYPWRHLCMCLKYLTCIS